MRPARRRVLGIAILGVLCVFIAGFAAIYTYAYSLVPHPTAAPESARPQDPHLTKDLFSRADLAQVMTPVPGGARATGESYEANAYCLDACPTLTRTYRFASGKRGACAAIVAAAAAYAREGYVPDARLPATFRGALPKDAGACLSAHPASFRISFMKDTSPISRTSFALLAAIANDGTLSMRTSEF